MSIEPIRATQATRAQRRWRPLIETIACAIIALGSQGQALAQSPEACKAEKVGTQKMVDFPTAFAAAEKRVRAWQPDAAVVRLTQTTLGPIDTEARSANWYMAWFSPATKKRIAITIANGVMTCYQDTDDPGRTSITASRTVRR